MFQRSTLLLIALIGTGLVVAGVAAFSRDFIPLGYVKHPDAALNGYFPSAFSKLRFRCDSHEGKGLLDSFEVDWYSAALTAAKEPSLVSAFERRPTNARVYRFTWLRSFDEPIFVRLTEVGDRIDMSATRLSGAGGYEPGTINLSLERQLTKVEALRFHRALSQANQLKVPVRECKMMFDGAWWIFEGIDRSGYRFAQRKSPDAGNLRNLGLVMLSFTGWKTDPIY